MMLQHIPFEDRSGMSRLENLEMTVWYFSQKNHFESFSPIRSAYELICAFHFGPMNLVFNVYVTIRDNTPCLNNPLEHSPYTDDFDRVWSWPYVTDLNPQLTHKEGQIFGIVSTDTSLLEQDGAILIKTLTSTKPLHTIDMDTRELDGSTYYVMRWRWSQSEMSVEERSYQRETHPLLHIIAVIVQTP